MSPEERLIVDRMALLKEKKEKEKVKINITATSSVLNMHVVIMPSHFSKPQRCWPGPLCQSKLIKWEKFLNWQVSLEHCLGLWASPYVRTQWHISIYMDYHDGICQDSQNRSTDIGRGTIHLSDLTYQALDYIFLKKKVRAIIFLKWSTHSHTGPAIQTYTVLSVWDQENRTMCKTPWSDYHFSGLCTLWTRQEAA